MDLILYKLFEAAFCTGATVISIALLIWLLLPKMLRRRTLLVRQTRLLAAADVIFCGSLALGWIVTFLSDEGMRVLGKTQQEFGCKIAMSALTLAATAMFYMDVAISLGVFAATRSNVGLVKKLATWFPVVWVFALCTWLPSHFTLATGSAVRDGFCFVRSGYIDFFCAIFAVTGSTCILLCGASICQVKGCAPNCVEVRILRRGSLFFFSYTIALLPMAIWALTRSSKTGWFALVAYAFLPLKGVSDAMAVLALGYLPLGGDAPFDQCTSTVSNFNVRFAPKDAELLQHWSLDRDVGGSRVSTPTGTTPCRSSEQHVPFTERWSRRPFVGPAGTP